MPHTSLALNALRKEQTQDVAARVSHDAQILKRVQELQREGLWSQKRISKLPEPPR